MATDFTDSFPHGGPSCSNEGGAQCGAADVAGAANKDRPADVSPWGSSDGLWAEVPDDGRGVDTASPASPIHRGITGTRERAGLPGGHLETDSEPAVGTRMRLEAPLANARS